MIVPTGRLVASILISDVGLFAEAVTVALIATAVLSPSAAEGVVRGGLVWIIGVVTLVWRRFNQEYRLTVAESPDGLRVHSGPRRADRGDDQAGPRSGRAHGRAAALAAARLVPARGRRRRAISGRRARGRRSAAACARCCRSGRGRSPTSCSSASSPIARRRLAAAAAGPLEEPAALPDAPRGPELRRASSRRAGGCGASPAGFRSRRRRASARCRARCSGACGSRPSTSTRSGAASAPSLRDRDARGGRPRARRASRACAAAGGAATRPSRRRARRRGRARSRPGSAPRTSRARRSGRSRRRTGRGARRRAAG